jgi:hypothetical protein
MTSKVFYGAGQNAADKLTEFIEKQGEPVCFVDKDKEKIGRKFPRDITGKPSERGYDILSLDDALSKYPGCQIYLTLIPHNLLAVTDQLVEQGFPKERIHYLEDVEYRPGCEYLGTKLMVNNREIRPCCYPKDVGITFTSEPMTEKTLRRDIETFSVWIDETLEKLRGGEKTDCDGCQRLRMDIWRQNPDIEIVTAGIRFAKARCNCRCIYCCQRDIVFNGQSKQEMNAYEIHRVLVDMYGYSIKAAELAEGEITVAPYRDKLLDLLLAQGWGADVSTNAILYNHKLAELLKRRYSRLSVSLDAGTAETFHRIKGLDAFRKVLGNLEKYRAEGARITLKYIMLPGINDNNEDLDGFIAIAKRLDASIVVSNDFSNDANLPGRDRCSDIDSGVFLKIEYLVARCKEQDVRFEFSYGNFSVVDCKRLEKLLEGGI